jgi:hypothetical protein
MLPFFLIGQQVFLPYDDVSPHSLLMPCGSSVPLTRACASVSHHFLLVSCRTCSNTLLLCTAISEYKLLLGYVLAAWYVSNVVARPKALEVMKVDDFFDLLDEGVALMPDFKTQTTYLVQPLFANVWMQRYD